MPCNRSPTFWLDAQAHSLELTDNQRQCVLIYQLDAVGVLAKGEHRHRVPGSLACPRGRAGSLGLRK